MERSKVEVDAEWWRELQARDAHLQAEIEKLSKGIYANTTYPEALIQGSAIDSAVALIMDRKILLLQIHDMRKRADEEREIKTVLYRSYEANACRLTGELATTKEELEKSIRLNAELLALLKKVDAVFAEPKIVDTGHGPILEIPYEVAAGVRGAMVNTSSKRKAASHCYEAPGCSVPHHPCLCGCEGCWAAKRKGEAT